MADRLWLEGWSRGRMVSALLYFFCLSGCGHQIVSPALRQLGAVDLAAEHQWQAWPVETPEFTLMTFLPSLVQPHETLTVYLEGDGLAWIGSTTPSENPTPVDPVGLKLALEDTGPAAYIARPCQYIASGCDRRYWTSHRFSPEVVRATQVAVDQLKLRFSATRLVLVGYSGGGALAALVASERKDVTRLVTVAGNLDHVFWTQQHHISPLKGSLNPPDRWRSLQEISQTHFVGAADVTVDRAVVDAYLAHFGHTERVKVVVVPKFTHHCCWVRDWRRLMSLPASE